MAAYSKAETLEALKTTGYALLFCFSANIICGEMWKQEKEDIKKMTGYDLNQHLLFNEEPLYPSSLGLNGRPSIQMSGK